jgi:DNA-binding MarR family transcriptional regulator
MARRLRSAVAEREEFIGRYRERFDRSQDDLRMTPKGRVTIAGEFLRSAHKADHVYEDRVKEALDEYRELMSTELDSR